VYPVGARSMNVSGKVDVRIVISEKGRVIEATIISGHMALQSAALEAALQWVYKPASRNGVPVKSESVLNFTFTPVQKSGMEVAPLDAFGLEVNGLFTQDVADQQLCSAEHNTSYVKFRVM